MLTIKNWARKNGVILLTLAVVLAGCMPKGPRALLEGKKLIETGRYPEAVEKLQIAIATPSISTNAAAWNYLALACHHAGRLTNAEQAYLRALSLDRNLVEARYNLGCLRLEQNRLEPAKAELIAYTSLRGNSVDGWLKLATVQSHLREFPAAEKSFAEVLRLDRENPEALNGLGMIQLLRNRPRDAFESFKSALKARPDYAPALLNLAIVNHTYLNNRPLALQEYREYLALPSRPANWESVNATALALDQELNPHRPSVAPAPPQAQLQPTQQVQVQPRPAPTVTATATRPPATAVIRNEAPTKPAPAVSVAKAPPTSDHRVPAEVVELPPEQTIKPAQEIAAASRPATSPRSESPSGTPPPAAKAAPAKPQKRGFFQSINPINLFRSGNASNAPATPTVAEAEPAAKMSLTRYKYRNPAKPAAGDRASAERAFTQGLQAQQAERFPEAIQAYRQATQLDPAYFEAHFNSGLAASAAGNLSQALASFEMALAIRPDSQEARYSFALVLKQANYIVDSVNELEKILRTNPNDARSHVILGNLYAQQLRQPAKAKEHYQKALELDPRNPQAQAIRFWMSSH